MTLVLECSQGLEDNILGMFPLKKGDENAKVMTVVTARGEQLILRRGELMALRVVPKIIKENLRE